MIKKIIVSVLHKLGYEVKRTSSTELPPDMDLEFQELYKKCKNYTMTSPERMFALYQAVKYAVVNNIPGDLVECGVWRGGSSMLIALTLLKFGNTNKSIFLYDTYEGMSAPTERDIMAATNSSAKEKYKEFQLKNKKWAYAPLEEVKDNMLSTGYPPNKVHFVKGTVEDTLLREAPSQIALLRLDTDWYESTLHELKCLFPRLSKGGVLIIDDYGHWKGAREAVDEYFKNNNIKALLHRIDATGRILIKV